MILAADLVFGHTLLRTLDLFMFSLKMERLWSVWSRLRKAATFWVEKDPECWDVMLTRASERVVSSPLVFSIDDNANENEKRPGCQRIRTLVRHEKREQRS